MKNFLNKYEYLINTDNKDSWKEFYIFMHGKLSLLSVSKISKMLETINIDPLKKLDFIPGGFYFMRDDLVSCIIPNNITGIAFEVFKGCINLKYLYIPKTIISIGANIFQGCNLNQIVVEYEGNEKEFNNMINLSSTYFKDVTLKFLDK